MDLVKNERPLEVIETEIHFYKQQTATGIIEIGKRLIEAKSQLQHGEWGKWLEEKVDFKERTAQRFMQVATEFSNTSTLTDLPKSKIFALLDVPSEERESFIQENNVSEMTTRELQEAIKAKKELEIKLNKMEGELKEANNRPAEVKVVEKIKDNTDYKTIDTLKMQLKQKDTDADYLRREKEILEKKVKLNDDDARKFKELQQQIGELTHTREDIRRQIEATTSISELVVDINNLIKTKLAPIKYSKAILEAKNDDIVIRNLGEILYVVESWCADMRNEISTNDYIIIDGGITNE